MKVVNRSARWNSSFGLMALKCEMVTVFTAPRTSTVALSSRYSLRLFDIFSKRYVSGSYHLNICCTQRVLQAGHPEFLYVCQNDYHNTIPCILTHSLSHLTCKHTIYHTNIPALGSYKHTRDVLSTNFQLQQIDLGIRLYRPFSGFKAFFVRALDRVLRMRLHVRTKCEVEKSVPLPPEQITCPAYKRLSHSLSLLCLSCPCDAPAPACPVKLQFQQLLSNCRLTAGYNLIAGASRLSQTGLECLAEGHRPIPR